MSEDTKVPSGEPKVQPSGLEKEIMPAVSPSGTKDNKQKMVAYDTLSKSIAQEKNAKERANTAEAKAQELERKLMAMEGRKDELIQSLKEENQTIKAEKAKSDAEKANEKISKQVMMKAAEMGCVDADLATSLIDVSKLDIDANFQVGDDSLSIMLDKLKREKAYLFSTQKAAIVDGLPKVNVDGMTPQAPDYNNMTTDEAKDALAAELSKFM